MSGLRLFIMLLLLLSGGLAHASYSSFDGAPRASDEELDRMRGGFVVSWNGLEFLMPFTITGIERLTQINGQTFINGELMTASLNPRALTPLTQSNSIGVSVQNEVPADANSGLRDVVTVPVKQPLAQTASGSSVTSSGSDGAGSGSTINSAGTANANTGTGAASGPVAASDSAGIGTANTGTGAASGPVAASDSVGTGTATTGTGTPSGPVAASDSSGNGTTNTGTGAASGPAISSGNSGTQVVTNGSLIVIQNGVANTVVLPANVSLDSLATFIQNSVNNQVIRNITTLNITLNAQMLAAQARLNALNQSLNNLR